MPTTIAITWLAACASPPAPADALPAPSPTVTLEAPWRIVAQDATSIVVRNGDSGDGARIQLAADDRGRVPGVTPIARGTTREVVDEGSRWPLVAVAYPDRALTAVDVTSEGPDLRVRFAGPALAAVAADPTAPQDPVLTWVRLRPRGTSWRVVVDGVGTISLPGAATATAQPDGSVALEGSGHHAALTTTSPATRSGDDGARWWLANHDSIAARVPYPRTSLTLDP